MSTGKTFQIKSFSSDDTYALGDKLGKACIGGEVFFLSSDLGGGKTTFTKGLAKGLGSKEQVTSPTFTINNLYKCKNGKELHHFDFYRLNDAGIMSNEISELAGDPEIIVAVEWGDIVDDVLPKDRIVIEFLRTKDNEDERQINIMTSDSMQYLVKDLL